MDDYLHTGKARANFSINDVAQFLFILLVAKFLKSSGIYLFYDLLKHIHIVQLLFYTSFIASIFFVILQKPFSSHGPNNKRINRHQYIKIFKYSLVQTIIRILWLFGLTQCGPLRTTLIFEQSEVVILCALKAIFLSQSSPTRSRGVIFLIVATLTLLAFDYDDVIRNIKSKGQEHPEGGTHHGIISHIFYFIVSWFQVSDHKAGVLLLVSTLFMQTGFNQSSLNKVLISDVGGTKRLKALSICMSTLILSPWAFFNLFSNVSFILKFLLT